MNMELYIQTQFWLDPEPRASNYLVLLSFWEELVSSNHI